MSESAPVDTSGAPDPTAVLTSGSVLEQSPFHHPARARVDSALVSSAVALLQILLVDTVAVIEDTSKSPDARLLAQRLAQNIERWDGGSDTVVISDRTRRVITARMTLAVSD